MAAAVKWFPPLPAGFEARWDPNQKAYFFINHSTKTTTWQDPRFSKPSSSPSPQRTVADHAQTSHGQGHAHAQGHSHTSQSHDGHGHANQSSPRLAQAAAEASHQESHVDEASLKKLKQQFPFAPDKLVLNALTRNHNVVSLAASELTTAGYSKSSGHHTSHHARHDPHDTGGATRHEVISDVDANHQAAAERLKAMFPAVRNDMVQDVLAGCKFNEGAAKGQLIAYGFHPTTHDHTRSPLPRPQTAKKSPKPELLPGQKDRLKHQLISDFPSLEVSIIEMSLESSFYDVDKARKVLQSWTSTNTSKSTSRHTASTSNSGSTSTGYSTPVKKFTGNLEPAEISKDNQYDPKESKKSTGQHTASTSNSGSTSTGYSIPVKKFTGNLEPAEISKDNQYDPKGSKKSTGQHTASTSNSGSTSTGYSIPVKKFTGNLEPAEISKDNQYDPKGSKKSSPSTTPSGSGHSTPSHSSKSTPKKQTPTPRREVGASHTRHPKGKHATHVNRHEVVTSEHVSSYHTTAKGPDPSLRRGPNKDLLLDEYSESKGPNPNLCHGPDPSRVVGSQGAHGPDPSLHCGPQSQPHHNLPALNPLLVSNV
ncbi:hypothetical protein ScPMuIL_011021 [Solemya velum]